MLGAEHVTGVDIDEQSLASARRSLSLNAACGASSGASGTVDFMHVSANPQQAARQIADLVQACGLPTCSFHFVFHYPNITLIHCSSFHFIFHYPNT